jgi:hypothetical protein
MVMLKYRRYIDILWGEMRDKVYLIIVIIHNMLCRPSTVSIHLKNL